MKLIPRKRNGKCGAHQPVYPAITAALLLTLTSTTTPVVSLDAAAQMFAMGGTGQPLSSPQESVPYVRQYLSVAATNFVDPALSARWSSRGRSAYATAPVETIAIITPEQARGNTGPNDLPEDQSIAQGRQILDSCIKGGSCTYNASASDGTPSAASDTSPVVVFGYSQSAVIATLEKNRLAAAYAADASSAPGPGALSFVLIGNPDRPNGGFLARGPQGVTSLFGGTFYGPTPTDTPYSTVDIAQQYDGAADWPENPLNLLADANALAGLYYLHPEYGDVSLTQPGVVDQGTNGDTTYYLVPARVIPLLIPLEQLPVIGSTLADTLDPTLRVLVESGYNRTISPGQPTPWNPLLLPNPIALGANLLVSIPTGLDNGMQDLFGVRPFTTRRPGPFGVGGPSVTYLTPPAATTTATPAAAAPVPSATTTAADTASDQPSSPTNSDAANASSLASQQGPAPQTGPATVGNRPVGDPPPGAGGSSSSAAATLGLPGFTRLSQPPIRLPAGAGRSGPKAPSTTAASSGHGPVSKVLGALRDALRPSAAAKTTPKTPGTSQPGDNAGDHPAASS